MLGLSASRLGGSNYFYQLPQPPFVLFVLIYQEIFLYDQVKKVVGAKVHSNPKHKSG